MALHWLPWRCIGCHYHDAICTASGSATQPEAASGHWQPRTADITSTTLLHDLSSTSTIYYY
jgi:hypothetical protein